MAERQGIGMGPKEMVEHMQQCAHVLAVTTRLCRSHVIDDHVADPLGAVLLVKQVLGQCARSDLGEVLVLGERQHLFLGQATEGDTVLEGNHGSLTREWGAIRRVLSFAASVRSL
jgi:hypothetical protein